MNYNSRHIFGFDLDIWRHHDAQLGEHGLETLHGVGGGIALVAAAVEAHYQAVANQLVAPDARDGGQVFDALRLGLDAEQRGDQ